MGANSVALLEHHPRRDPAQTGLVSGIANAMGIGVGALLSCALVEYAPYPEVLPYVVVVVSFSSTCGRSHECLKPLPDAPRCPKRYLPTPLGVPLRVMRTFSIAPTIVFVSWSVTGDSLALGPLSCGRFLGRLIFCGLASTSWASVFSRPWANWYFGVRATVRR